MKKSDLKDGMIVELRNGDMCIVMGNKLLDTSSYTYVDGYEDDLTEGCLENLDIVKVYEDRNMRSLEDRYKKDRLKLIWEREKEVDWRTVKFGTKVRVWDDEGEKYESVFLEYVPNDKNYPFRAYLKEDNYTVAWENCELI